MKQGYISISNYLAESYVIFQDSKITHRLSVDDRDEESTVSLREFLTTLGITLKDCKEALEGEINDHN